MYKSRFLYVDDNGDYQEGLGTGIFITDIQPHNASKVVSNTYKQNVIDKNIIESSVTNDNEVDVTVEWDGSGYDWNGSVVINNIPVNNAHMIGDSRRFVGTVTIPVDNNTTEIVSIHTDGAIFKCDFSVNDTAPIITNVKFINGYPGTQTEVKENDTYDVEIEFDTINGSVPTSIEIIEYGAMKGGHFSNIVLTNNKVVITGIVNSTGFTPQLLPVRVISEDSFGAISNQKDSNENGSVDGVNVIKCNDIIPSFSFNSVSYPPNQLAFKDIESGSVDIAVNNFTSVLYTSPNNDFNIDNNTTYDQIKTIHCTNPGTYNDSVHNYKIEAHRAENDTNNSIEITIEVADTSPIINITQQYNRLRSSPVGMSYIITATSNQNLASTPSMEINIPVSGTWEGSGWNGTLKVKTRHINIKDSDAKGSGDWSFITAPTNRAGIAATINGTEVVGGFVSRTLTIPAWPNREVNIGTLISDVSKLHCENLSKGGNAPHGGTIFTYKPTTDNELNKFTITGANDTWYNCDQPNATSNTSGTAQVIIEEGI